MGSVLDKLAKAETSSDLRHYAEPCHVDVVKAAGLAGIMSPIGLSLYRLKYLHDFREKEVCERKFIKWACISLMNRGFKKTLAEGVGTLALAGWIDDTCTECAGQKYEVPAGAAALTAKVCQTCNGLGKKPIKGGLAEVTKDIFERADDKISSVRGIVEDRLRG